MRISSVAFIALTITATVYGQFACTDTNASGAAANTCFCNANFYGTSTDAGGSGCVPCPGGTSSQASTATGTLVSSCMCNDTNASLMSDNSACQCNANFYGTPNNVSGGSSGCTQCPSGQTAPAGSTSNVCANSNASTTSSKLLQIVALIFLLAILI
ncbi:hypothetical protein ABPG72_021855 [Tetrahymena utriculariae]